MTEIESWRVQKLLLKPTAGAKPTTTAAIAALKAQGVAEIFTPGTPTTEIVAWVERNVGKE